MIRCFWTKKRRMLRKLKVAFSKVRKLNIANYYQCLETTWQVLRLMDFGLFGNCVIYFIYLTTWCLLTYTYHVLKLGTKQTPAWSHLKIFMAPQWNLSLSTWRICLYVLRYVIRQVKLYFREIIKSKLKQCVLFIDTSKTSFWFCMKFKITKIKLIQIKFLTKSHSVVKCTFYIMHILLTTF